MTALAGPLFIACIVLAAGGAAKAVRPLPTRRALYAMGWPSAGPLVRLLGIIELVAAVVAAVVGGLAPLLVGALYVGFAGFVVLAMRDGSVASCGCFGSADTPPSSTHVVLNLAAAAVAFASVGTDGLTTVLADQPGAGVPFAMFVAVGGYAAILAFTLLPSLQRRVHA